MEDRAYLSSLRKKIRENDNPAGDEALKTELHGFWKKFPDYLESEDAKTRKNAALLAAEIKSAGMHANIPVETLIEAFRDENTMFVRSAYLTALQGQDISLYKEELLERLTFLRTNAWEESELKHVREERHALEKLLQDGVPASATKHEFSGLKRPMRVLFTCDEIVRETVKAELGDHAMLTPTGVRAEISNLSRITQSHLYRDLLFLVPVKRDTMLVLENVGQLPVISKLMDIIRSILPQPEDNSFPYRFRLEIQSPLEADRQGTVTKRIAAELEESSGGELRNDAGNYELILILKAKKDHTFIPYVSVPALDQRFDYRTAVEPTSLAPLMAAEIIELSKDFLKKDAQVMDPFCGTGALLFERMYRVPAGDVYGTDIYGHAILGARENAENFERQYGQKTAINLKNISFINRNFFDFTHEYPFDEVLTDFPDLFDKETAEKEKFYRTFFDKALDITAAKANLILVSKEDGLIHKHLRLREELRLVKEIPIRKHEKIYIIEKR